MPLHSPEGGSLINGMPVNSNFAQEFEVQLLNYFDCSSQEKMYMNQMMQSVNNY